MGGFGIRYNSSLSHGDSGGTGKEETLAENTSEMASTPLVTKGGAGVTVGSEARLSE